MSDYFKELKKQTGNDLANVAVDGIVGGDVKSYVDTGSYMLNALLSGSIYGGLPSNKILTIAGPSTTGKTIFTLGIVKHFLSSNPDAGVMYFESESAISKSMLVDHGIDITRLIHIPVKTIEEFRYQCVKVLEGYQKTPESERPPLMICLDSFGMLSTTKEVTDISEGNEKRDMTRAQVAKGTFRVLTLMLGLLNVPMIMTNHVYQEMGLFPKTVMGGGTGGLLASDYVMFLSKKKEKDGTDVIGNIVHCLNYKSRLTIENKKVDVMLSYNSGLSRYYGLLELADKYKIFGKTSTRFELPDGSKVFGKTINSDPEKYFTKDILDKLDDAADTEFKYGNARKKVVVMPETKESDV